MGREDNTCRYRAERNILLEYGLAAKDVAAARLYGKCFGADKEGKLGDGKSDQERHFKIYQKLDCKLINDNIGVQIVEVQDNEIFSIFEPQFALEEGNVPLVGGSTRG